MSKRLSRGRFVKAYQASPSVAEAGPHEILGERLRKYSLGLTAALLTCRAFWPSEPDIRNGAGAGLTWILLLLLAAGLGITSAIVRGQFTFRRTWTDLAVVALVGLVALSATHAIDHRPAINLAWEWLALGIAYLLVRNLPRNRAESTALAGALVATAVAVTVYGLYQVQVELPALRDEFLRNPQKMMEAAGVAPTATAEAMFRSRLLGSNEVFSTFGHPNSLAGFLVGPIVITLSVILANLLKSQGGSSRLADLLKAALPTLAMVACLVMTKSRSAYIGLAVGALLVLWQARQSVTRRMLCGVVAVGSLLLLAIGVVAWKRGQLDLLVITESSKSLRTRLEYWQSTWSLLTDGSTSIGRAVTASTLWSGVGPGNFGSYYLLYKLPQASDEIQDPHNMLLEVWATAGLFALIALLAALFLGLRDILGPAGTPGTLEVDQAEIPSASPQSGESRVGWLIASAGAGWILVILLGQINPFEGNLFIRWLILGASWLGAVQLGKGLWKGPPLLSSALAAGALGLMLNLLAAGGIGFPAVALSLWTMIALGQNLREDRPCGELRVVNGQTAGLTAAGVWAAVVGSFLGAVVPFWNSESAMNSADRALEGMAGPNYQGAEAALLQAMKADPYDARPYRKMAGLEMRAWQERGARPEDLRWQTVPISLLKAVTLPRNPRVWSLHAERADVMRTILAILARGGGNLKETDRLQYLGNIVEATRTATLLYPNNATLHAKLALASADVSVFADAAAEATEALRLDGLMPHEDKKLPEPLRKQLEDNLTTWKQRAAEMPIGAAR